LEGTKVLQQFISAIFPYRLAKFGRVPFAEFHVRSLAMKQHAELTEGG